MLLESENLRIRNATESDAEQLALWWNDGAVMAHAGFPLGLGTDAETVAASLSLDDDGTHRRLIIEIDGVPAGEMNYRNKGGGVAEIGIKICDETKRNRGCGKKLLSMLITSLFSDMGYAKIILDTNLENTRAQHVYETLGFRRLRINRDAWKDQLGRPQSSVDYELCPGDFHSFAAGNKPGADDK